MARLLYIFVFLFVTSCAHIPQESPQLPEKFLGLWHPYSDDLFQNAVVDGLGVILFPSTYEQFKINTIWTYKTVMIEGDNAYLLVKQEKGSDFLKKNPKFINPYYMYIRLEYDAPKNLSTKLRFVRYSYYLPEEPYSLTAKDWDLPISEHKKRINYMHTNSNFGANSETYSR